LRSWFSFTLEHWNLYDSSPTWNQATQGSVEEKLQKLTDPDGRERMRNEYEMLRSIGSGTIPENLTVIATPGYPELQKYVGRKISEIAKEEQKHPNDAMLDIAVAGGLKVEFRGGNITSDNVEEMGALLSDPHVMPGVSDGGAHTKFFTGGSFTTDFLTWLVRDTGKISLEEAHYHLSYLPAQAAGFVDRGYLREGAPADIVVYDLEKLKRVPEWEFEIVRDMPAGEWRRIQRSEGYRWTIVNGQITFEDGNCTGATPGRLLRNGKIGRDAFSAAA
jgi:N-acyl-D-aspartate/D-glutamate deacylase